MFFLFLVFSFSQNSFLALGIWSGKENIGSRVLSQAKTWMRFWSDIYVFTDELPEKDCEKVREAAKPCDIHFIVLSNYSEHLEDTEWVHRWYFAQPRFLPAMRELWKQEPNVSWYVFGDDDTYIFREPLLRKLSKFDENQRRVIGRVWCSNSQFAYILKKDTCLPFAQGGAGVAISKRFMNEIGDELLKCNQEFNHPDFAGSMRFAFCSERKFGKDVWSASSALTTWPEGFHADPPNKEFASGMITTAPATFHRVFPPDFPKIAKTHYAEYSDIDSNSYMLDLSIISYTRHRIPLGSLNLNFDWLVGYCITEPGRRVPMFNATSSWSVTTNHKGEIVSLSQQYEKGITMTLQCCPFALPGKLLFEKFADEEGSKPVFNVSCSQFPIVKIQ